MKNHAFLIRVLVALMVVSVLLAPSAGVLAADTPDPKKSESGYQVGFVEWRGSEGGFAAWTRSGAALGTAPFAFDSAAAQPGADPYAAGEYYGGNYYNAGTFFVDEITGPVVESGFAVKEAIASWNADTPPGTWIETLVRARIGERWTKWYNLGIWALEDETIQRHSVRLQGDADGYVSVDTLVLSKGKLPADALQLSVRLFSEDGEAIPSVSYMSLAYSGELPRKFTTVAGDPELWNQTLAVPECSQMVYPDGGNVWCSPTSVSMVLGYYGFMPGDCELRVRATVKGVYDWIYDGHGNWPFNTAYAAGQGFEGSVRRFTSLAGLEPWIANGVPVVLSIAWGKGELTGAPIPSSSGHLVVLVGFDANGDPVVNDPAAAADADVQRTYIRAELENAWLANSGGTVYIIR